MRRGPPRSRPHTPSSERLHAPSQTGRAIEDLQKSRVPSKESGEIAHPLRTFLRCFDFNATTELIKSGKGEPDPRVQAELDKEVKLLTQSGWLAELYRLHPGKRGHTKRRERILDKIQKDIAAHLGAHGLNYSILQVFPDEHICCFQLRAGKNLHDRETADWAPNKVSIPLVAEQHPAPTGRPLTQRPTPQPAPTPLSKQLMKPQPRHNSLIDKRKP